MKLADYQVRVVGVPASIFYIPDFLNGREEAALMEGVARAPRPTWVHLGARSLQQYGGVPTPRGMIAQVMPAWLQCWVDRLGEMKIFDEKVANHVLMNRYEPGQGIMPHTDGPMYHPVVATLNTGSHTVLNFYRKNDGYKVRQYQFSLNLQPRSLLVLKEDAYNKYEHSIHETITDRFLVPVDSFDSPLVINLHEPDYLDSPLAWTNTKELQVERTQTRFSFTIRHVPNVIKGPSWLFKMK